jgi:hypothetical protein
VVLPVDSYDQTPTRVGTADPKAPCDRHVFMAVLKTGKVSDSFPTLTAEGSTCGVEYSCSCGNVDLDDPYETLPGVLETRGANRRAGP